jgi:hypothetical protein
MKLMLEIILLVALPYGTAFIMGALAERLGGKTLSSWAAVGSVALGIYFFHKSLDIIIAS